MLDVVISEHRIAAVAELLEQRAQQPLAARPRDEVAGDENEVGLARARPFHRAPNGTRAARRETEMEVREVHDPQAGELRLEPRDRQVDPREPDPTGLEPTPGEPAGCEASE